MTVDESSSSTMVLAKSSLKAEQQVHNQFVPTEKSPIFYLDHFRTVYCSI